MRPFALLAALTGSACSLYFGPDGSPSPHSGGSSHGSDTGPDAFQSWSRTLVPLDFFVEGHDKVKVKVRSVLR